MSALLLDVFLDETTAAVPSADETTVIPGFRLLVIIFVSYLG